MRHCRAAKTAAIGERPDDDGGPAVALPALSMGQDLIAGVQFAEVAVDERLGRLHDAEDRRGAKYCGRALIRRSRRAAFSGAGRRSMP